MDAVRTSKNIHDEALDQDVLTALRRIIHAVDLHSKQVAKQTGLTTPQVVVLKAIAVMGEVTAGKLSNHVSLSQATVTTILDRLERGGLIERYRSRQDKRIVHTRLTRDGKKALRHAPPLLNQRFTEMYSALSRHEQLAMVRTLENVAVMLGGATLDVEPIVHLDV